MQYLSSVPIIWPADRKYKRRILRAAKEQQLSHSTAFFSIPFVVMFVGWRKSRNIHIRAGTRCWVLYNLNTLNIQCTLLDLFRCRKHDLINLDSFWFWQENMLVSICSLQRRVMQAGCDFKQLQYICRTIPLTQILCLEVQSLHQSEWTGHNAWLFLYPNVCYRSVNCDEANSVQANDCVQYPSTANSEESVEETRLELCFPWLYPISLERSVAWDFLSHWICVPGVSLIPFNPISEFAFHSIQLHIWNTANFLPVFSGEVSPLRAHWLLFAFTLQSTLAEILPFGPGSWNPSIFVNRKPFIPLF